MKARLSQHLSASKQERYKNFPVYNAFRKYGFENLVIDVLIECDTEYALLMESKLRPLPSIGWNQGPGGSATTLGYKHSEVTKEHLRKKWKTRPPKSQETSRKQSLAKEGRNCWLNNAACKSAWLQANTFYSMFKDGERFCDIYRALGVSISNCLHMKRKIVSGWNPSEDSAWLAFKEQYLTEQEALNA